MIIDCVSDLHGHYPELEGGDLLIVAGDLTATGLRIEYLYFSHWLKDQKYRMKIVIGGNHDNNMGDVFACGDLELGIEHLSDSGTQFDGLKIWGSSWTKSFIGMNPHCNAFTVDTEEELAEKWSLIPDDTDILITHSPAWGTHDKNMYDINCGSTSLNTWIAYHVDILKLHVCGHIHEGYGIYDIRKFQVQVGDKQTPVFVNASIMDEYYYPANKPLRVLL